MGRPNAYNPFWERITLTEKTSVWQRFWNQAKAYKVDILIGCFGFAVMNGIFLAKAFRETATIRPESAGQFGDFVGGYVGTLFSLISILLLFRTLQSQRIASLQQSFENKHFELLKLHRDNVAELELQSATGRKLFVLMLRELRCALDIVRSIADRCKQQLTQRELMHIAYYCFFFGVGPNSSRMLRMSLARFDSEFINAIEAELNSSPVKEKVQKERNFGFVPFEGHQSRLGHYYRHLYQMVRYVDQQTLGIAKYEYVKTIRAQLSTHEQAMLLVNSLTPMGKDWWREELLVRYKMVQNIPQDFFDRKSELDTDELFDPGYFEWEDVEELAQAQERS